MTPLLKNDTHALIIEKVGTDYWIELVNRESGNVQIIYAKRKDKAMGIFKGMTMEEIIPFYKNVETVSMYKKGVI